MTIVQPLRLLSDQELTNLLGAAQSPRNRALISLLVGTGIHLAEVPQLDTDCVMRRPDGSALIYLPSGGSYTGRLLPIVAAVREAVDGYLADREVRIDDISPLFVGSSGGRIRGQEVGLAVLSAMRAAGIDCAPFVRQDAEGLRLADVLTLNYADRQIRTGADVATVAQQLGYRSAAATRSLASQLARLSPAHVNTGEVRPGFDPETSAPKVTRAVSTRPLPDTGALQLAKGSGVIEARTASGAFSLAISTI